MKKTSFGCIGVALVVVLGVSLFFNLAMVIVSSGGGFVKPGGSGYFEKEYLSGDGKDQIAVIPMYGLISYGVPGTVMESMVDDMVEKLRQAREDEDVKAVILRIDSPGGEVTASDVIYHEVVKTDQVKPVVVFMDSVAASGGYYVSVGGRYLMANELSITGSIGVILQTINVKELSEKIGLHVVTVKSGKMKDMLNPFRETKPEELAFLQAMIDETYGKFLGVVAQERGMDAEKLRSTIADGRILSGKKALEAGLIDATGYFEDGVSKARELAGLDEASVVEFQAPVTLGRLLRKIGSSLRGSANVNIKIGPQSLDLESGKFYYVSPHLFGN